MTIVLTCVECPDWDDPGADGVRCTASGAFWFPYATRSNYRSPEPSHEGATAWLIHEDAVSRRI